MSSAPTISIVTLLGTMSQERRQALFAQDPACAAPWIHAVAVEGVPEAQVTYARLLLEGTGVDKDAAAALSWFQRAAVRGNVDALNMVGRCHDNGWGTPENPQVAAEYYTRAAAADHPWAQYNLGHLYLDGRGAPRNAAKAYTLYRRAADHGHERAMNLVGRCTEEGWGTSRDAPAAAYWYRRSAQAGYFRGQYNWATVLLKAGAVKDAAQWLERAASGGNSEVRGTVTALVNALVRRGGAMDLFEPLAARLNASASNLERVS